MFSLSFLTELFIWFLSSLKNSGFPTLSQYDILVVAQPRNLREELNFPLDQWNDIRDFFKVQKLKIFDLEGRGQVKSGKISGVNQYRTPW